MRPIQECLPGCHARLACTLVVALVPWLALAARQSGAVEYAEICRYLDAAVAAAADPPGEGPRRNYAPDRQVDVTHIKLDITPNFDRRTVSGSATLRFAPISRPLESLRLDGIDLQIAKIRSSHKIRDWSASKEDVTIVFDAPVPVGEESWVEIDYAAEPVGGLYFRTPEMGFPEGDIHCWTQGETQEARHWVPCFDYPNERSSTELICHVPADMTVVSNGRLTSEDASDDGKTKTFHWLQEKPHVSYLICFIAGKLEKIEGRHRDVPLGFYSQPSKAQHAANPFADTADIMKFFESEIGVDFPWDKYDQATIADFMFGGMENTSITTLTQRTVFEDPKNDIAVARARSLNAHEMAHQWFGDYVTCKDWSHTWLNEGFATYYAHLYDGHKCGRDALLYGLYEDAEGILARTNDSRPIVFRGYNDPQEQFDFRAYPKGSWVLHMLRSHLGEEMYREAVRTYLQRHALGNVESEDLREVFEELSGLPLDRFFDQWVYHGGAPELTVQYRWLAKERLAHVTVKQTQQVSESVLLFELPTKLRFVVDGKAIDEPVTINKPQHDFYVSLPKEPKIVRFDPEYTMLAKVTFEAPDALVKAQLENEADVIGRLLACEALAKKGKDGNVGVLKRRLQDDPFFGVRRAAATALRQIGTDAAVDALVESVDQDDARVRRQVVEELGRCFQDKARAKLLEVATDDDELPVVAAAAVAALGRVSGDATAEAVREALESRSFNNERLQAALQAIRDLNEPEFADDIIELINEDGGELSPQDLTEAFTTLSTISQRGRRREAAYDALREYLDHPRLSVRSGAIQALGSLRDARARALLQPFTADGQDARLRAAARGALAALERDAQLAPDEVRDLRLELRDLRESQDKLKTELDELKSKSKADESKTDGSKTEESKTDDSKAEDAEADDSAPAEDSEDDADAKDA